MGARVREAAAAGKAKDWARAVSLWDEIIRDYGTDAPQARSERARAHERLLRTATSLATSSATAERWSDAVALWQDVFAELGSEAPPHAYVSLSRAYRRLGQLDEASEVVENGFRRYPDNRGLFKERANIATSRRDWRKAFRCWVDLANLPGASGTAQLAGRKAAAAFLALATSNPADQSAEDMALLNALGLGDETALAVDGILALRAGEFDRARDLWERYWRLAAGETDDATPFTVDGFQDVAGNVQFPVVERNAIDTPTAPPGRYCVYTAMFDAYDEIRPPLYKPPGIDFICFSDKPISAPGWTVKLVDRPHTHPGLSNRRLKIHPYDYVGDYRYSLYVDSNVQLVSDISLLVTYWLEGKPFVGWRHSARSDVYDELETILIKSKHPPRGIVDQYEFFRREGMPRNVGLVEASVLWRDHEDQDVLALMQRWWDHLQRFGYRDQPGLAYLLWRDDSGIAVLPAEAGNLRANGYFVRHLHRMSPFEVDRGLKAGAAEGVG